MIEALSKARWMQDGPVRAAADGALRCAVTGRSLLAVTGTDAAEFLHAQLSTDVRSLAPGEARLSSYSDARGRLLAVPRLLVTGDGFLMELPADSAEAVASQLRRYVLRARVEIEPVPADWVACGIAGPAGSDPAAPLGEPLPLGGTWVGLDGGAHLATCEGPVPRALLFGPEAALRRAWERLEDLAPAAAASWDLLDIEAGLPCIHAATRGHFVAQMVNLDRLGALDFRKGCYPGQEVIARTHYLGRVKRRMYPLRAERAPEPPAAGEPVHDAAGHAAGELVRAAPHPAGGCLALAVLRLDAIDGPLTLADGTPVTRRDPPYPLDEAA
ncbi:MAG: folate-binding protein [Halofilum sp. (in: g-proteobacteria)]|nr:folate-binding protein [Halofilum sp. (in: g-proteobacteria)]